MGFKRILVAAVAALASVSASASLANGASLPSCKDLPGHATFEAALIEARGVNNGGFDLDMWITVVDRDGVVCAVAYTGSNRGDQWPGSRVISAQKAHTANAFSLPGLALSTANLWAATQPGGSLYGLPNSNPMDSQVIYGLSNRANGSQGVQFYGTPKDPMVGSITGGVNVFGGGLALYSTSGVLLGALGVSGDSSCADHNIAWRVRGILNLDNVPAGVATTGDDNIIYDVPVDGTTGAVGVSSSGFGQVVCNASEPATNAAIVAACPTDAAENPACGFAVVVAPPS